MATGTKQKRTGRYVRRAGWTHDDYIRELELLSIDDDSIALERPGWTLGPCRRWTGQLSGVDTGYAVYGVLGENRASRVSYRLHELNGAPLPKDSIVCHHCDRPACIKPQHLFVGTSKDNAEDMVAKGRQAKGEQLSAVRQAQARRGPERQTEETKAKISANNGMHTEAARQAVSRANKGKKRTPEMVEAMRKRQTGVQRGPYKKRLRQEGPAE